MPEPTEPAAYCTRKPTPGAYLSDGCPDCGHAIVLHVGVDHCPVCETVDLNRQLAWIVTNETPESETPDPGAPIHYRHPNSSTVCLDAEIVSTEAGGTATIIFPGGMERCGVTEDQSGRGADTWHWPCGGHDDEPAEPEPSGHGPAINITVNGTILSERDLADTIRRVLWNDKLRDLRNPGRYFLR